MSFRSLFRNNNETKLGSLLIRFSLAFLATFALLLGGGYLFQDYFIKSSYMHVRDLALLTENLDMLEKSLVEQESGQRGFSLTGESSFLGYYDRGLADYRRVSEALLTRSALTPDFSVEVDALVADTEFWQNEHSRSMMERSLMGETIDRETLQKGEAAFNVLNVKFDDLLARITVKRDLERSRLLDRISTTLALTGAAALLTIGLYVFFIIKHIRRLIQPLNELDQAISAYEGSLEDPARTDYTTSGELGRLVQAFHRMGEDLRRESGQLEDTYKMINALNQAGSVQDVYRETLLHMRNLVQCDKVSIVMQNADRRFFSKAVSQGERLSLKEALLDSEREELRSMIQGGKSLLYENWEIEHPAGGLSERVYRDGMRSSVHLLLKKDHRVIGILNLYSSRPYFFTSVKKQRLEKLVPLIATAIDNALQTSRIQSLAMRDGLTGLWNRRHFDEAFARLTEEARSVGGAVRPLSLILLDVDRFKLFNDTRGHQEGDAVLRHIALLLQAYCRFGDLPVRFGGEEFAVLLPNTPLEEAAEVATRLRKLIEFDSPSPDYRVTASFGVAQSHEGQDKQDLIRAADSALYRAKAAGRNRVCTEEEGLNDSAESG